MKKSKVLIPAMALLLFSTAASITGTVAWFTSVRTFNTSAGDFTVAKLDGDLSCDITGLVGVTVNDNGTDHESITVPSTNVIGDASFDHVAKTLYTDTDVAGHYTALDTMVANDPATAGYRLTEANWLYNTVGTTNYYYAVAWKMTFSFDFGAKKENVNIFFDYKNSLMTPADNGTAHDSTNESAKAFRIALFTNTNCIVWSELHDGHAKTWTPPTSTSSGSWANATDTKTYVNSETGTDTYEDDEFIDSTAKAAAYTRATNGTATTGRKDFLGTIPVADAGGTGSITVTCVAWYDGTDLNLINETHMQKVSAKMQFYAADAAA